MVTNKSRSFPLDFDDKHWSVEEALPWVFFGDFNAEKTWADRTQYAVSYVVAEADDRTPSIYSCEHIKQLQKSLRACGIVRRNSTFTPLVWCRLAVQFWLANGYGQEVFTSAMTCWVKRKNRGGVAFVSYKCADSSKRRRIPLEAFLFGCPEFPDFLNAKWLYLHIADVQLPKAKSKKKVGRSDEHQVGKNLIGTVKKYVAELAINKRGKSFFLRDPDPQTGKFRYTGLRDELYDAICRIGPDIRGTSQLENGRNQKAYAKSSVIKAISKVVICRRSWT